MFANRVWKLRITDVMQGVVYGTHIPEITDTGLFTRFDIDEVWGTALNRFCTQAVLGLPVTPYGKGDQRRGFLSLEDAVSCLMIGLEKPPEEGEYRVYNQFDQHYSVNELAGIVKERGEKVLGRDVHIERVENPRVEMDQHYYNPENNKLKKMGYVPVGDLRKDIDSILMDVDRFRERAEQVKNAIAPRTFWKKSLGLH